MGRNPYADLLRVGAVGAVVVGHWLLTDVTYRGGRLSGESALDHIGWARWLTLLFQVMPAFFLVGGYANAASWTAYRERGGDWTGWVSGRCLRLLWPTTVYVGTVALAAAIAGTAAGGHPAELARSGWFLALHLWFLPVYLLLIALTPLLLAAHRRWRLAVPAAMAVGAAAVDAAVLGPHLPLIGFANYLLVWGSMHQWGFAWRDGSLTRSRRRLYALSAAGAGALAGLVAWGPFPIDMIGAGEPVGNTAPPSIALLAYAAAQSGLLLAAEPAGLRLVASAGRLRLLSRLNRAVMTVYLWHLVPVVIVAAAVYPAGVMPQPAAGTAWWWALRPLWCALLAALLLPLTAAVMRLQRPLLRRSAGWRAPPQWSALMLGCGLAAVVPALAKLAIGGFAPDGRPPPVVLAGYACGLVLTLLGQRPAAA